MNKQVVVFVIVNIILWPLLIIQLGQMLHLKYVIKKSTENQHIITEQQHRLDHLQQFCRRSKSPHLLHSLDHILVDDKHKVLYCYIPKAGCSAWKWNLMVMNTNDTSIKMRWQMHEFSFLQAHGIRRLNTYTMEEVVARVQKYFKFMFVRHPLTRLVSAYKNKFVNEYPKGGYYMRFGPKILEHSGRKVTNENGRIQFTDFVSYFLSNGTSLPQDEHFREFGKLCSPCAINYNFIGKQETFNDDSNYLLSTVFKKKLTIPNANHATGSGKESTYESFVNVPDKYKTILKQKYAEDFEMFDYYSNGYI